MSEKSLVTQAILWLTVPVMLFVGFWFRPEVGLPAVMLMAWCLWRILGRKASDFHSEGYHDVRLDRRNWFVLLAVIAYVVVSGIGGYVAQAPDDHMYRNAMLFDLEHYSWPVAFENPDGSNPLIFCYYFAYWLPSAAVFKLTGSMVAADIFLVLFTVWGTWIVLNFIFSSCGDRARWSVFWVFVLFNALNVVSGLIFSRWELSHVDGLWSIQLLWISTANGYFSDSANSIIYNFIYNQGIPVWVFLTLLLHEIRDTSRMMFIFGLLPAYAPIPAVGLAPYIAWRLIRGYRRLFTIENLTGLVVALLTAFFLIQNGKAGGFARVCSYREMPMLILMSFTFYAVSTGPFIAFFWRDARRNLLLWFTAAAAVIGAYFSLDKGTDFQWRVSLPFILLVCLYTCRKATDLRKMRKSVRYAFISLMIISSFSSVYLWVYTIRSEILVHNGERPRKYEELYGVFHLPNRNRHYKNFYVDNESFYSRRLMPRNIHVTTDAEASEAASGQPDTQNL